MVAVWTTALYCVIMLNMPSNQRDMIKNKEEGGCMKGWHSLPMTGCRIYIFVMDPVSCFSLKRYICLFCVLLSVFELAKMFDF
jgi:hypothetical protein